MGAKIRGSSVIEDERRRVIENGEVSLISKLIFDGVDLKGCDRYGFTALHWAVQPKGDVNNAKILLDSQTNDVNCSDNKGRTALHLACLKGHLDMVNFLIQRGADVDAVDGDGTTPILYAVIENYPDIVLMLVENGCNVNVSDEDGNIPLHWAVDQGDINLVHALFRSKIIDVDFTDEKCEKNTALHLAAQNGYEAIAKYLIENAANLDALNEDGKTPLQVATERGHKATCDLIREKM